MNNITDIILRLPGLIGTTINTQAGIPELYTIRDIMYHLQMSYYWLKQANKEAKAQDDSIVLISSEEGERPELIIPAITDTGEQLGYLKENLTTLSGDTWNYIGDNILTPSIEYKVEQAYNNMMLALFNTELSTTYYEQISRQREGRN